MTAAVQDKQATALFVHVRTLTALHPQNNQKNGTGGLLVACRHQAQIVAKIHVC